MMRTRILPLIAGIVLLCGCANDRPALPNDDPGTAPVASKEQIQRAERIMADLEEQILTIKSLPTDQRPASEFDLGKRFEDALSTTIGTRLENKNLYWLASWRLTYANGDGVDRLLNRLQRLSSPALKEFGEGLRVSLRLQQGRISEARTLVDDLITRIPEFATLGELVTFYQHVGEKAPQLPAKNLGGGPDDPSSLPRPRWLLYLFVQNFDNSVVERIASYRQTLSKLDRGGPPMEVGLVVVTFEAATLQALTNLQQMPAGAYLPQVLWVNPTTPGLSARWRSEWRLPSDLPHACLLGEDRTIMAVEVTPQMLARLLAISVNAK
jgi:hypothetical protein